MLCACMTKLTGLFAVLGITLQQVAVMCLSLVQGESQFLHYSY